MSRYLSIAVLLLVAIAAALYFTGEKPGSQEADDPLVAELSRRVPANTLFFALTEQALPLAVMRNGGVSASDISTFEQLLHDPELPNGFKFLLQLLVNYAHSLISGEQALKADWGFADEVASSTYMIGLAPVIEMSLAQPALAVEQIRNAAEQYELTVTSATEGADQLHRIVLFTQDDVDFTLVVREQTQFLRLALEGPADDALKQLISGATLPQPSLANTGVIKGINSNLEMKSDVVGKLNFLSLVNELTNPDSDSIKMLSPLLDEAPVLAEWQSESCQQDLRGWVSGMPEWIFASEISLKQNEADAASAVLHFTKALLKIENEGLAQQLGKLNGMVPAMFANDSYQPLFGFALGINVAELAPVAMQLHQAFLDVEFTCAPMIAAQSDMRQNNPASMAMAAAMVSSLRGMSLSLNDLGYDTQSESISGSALLSLSGTSINPLLAMAQGFSPELAQLNIPQDGSPVDFRISMLPEDVPPLKVAIHNDQHLVIMTNDEQALAQNQSFAAPAEASSQLMAMALDSGRLADIAQNIVESSPDLIATLDGSSCAELSIMQNEFEQLAMVVDGDLSFTPEGLFSQFSAEQSLELKSVQAITPAKYTVSMVTQGCAPVFDGYEQINADGSGEMRLSNGDPACSNATYESTYTWKQHGELLEFTFDKERSREEDVCDGEWLEWQDVEGDYRVDSCTIVEKDEEGFRCIFNLDGEMAEYVYEIAS